MYRRKRLPGKDFAENVTEATHTERMSSDGDLTFEQQCRLECERLRHLSPEIFRETIKALERVVAGLSDGTDVTMVEKNFYR